MKFITVLLITISSFFPSYGNDWRLVLNEKGVQVYTRPVPNAAFDEFKGVAVIDAKIEVIGELLRDIPSYPQWVKDCKEAKVLKKVDASNLTMYFVQDAPWPVSPRDVIMDVSTIMEVQKGKITISMSSTSSPLVKKNPDYVRIPTLTGAYILEYIDRNHTRVTYMSKADPGGSVPTSLANYSSRNIPFETLVNMKRMVKQAKYLQLGEKSVDKPLIEEAIKKGFLE
jgi:hypothetical protein